MATNQATNAKEQQTQGIEWDVVSGENTDFAAQYPRFQWVHGSAQASGFMKTGGLFISAENYPNFTGDGFQPETLITREGDEIAGFGASKAKLAVIRIKRQWVKDETYNKNVPLLHALVSIKGCEDIVNISLRGASKSLAFQRAFDTHLTQNVALANRTRPTGVPALEPFAIWFSVCAGQLQDISSKDGSSKSKVTPIELCSPETVDRDYVTTLWVGRENYVKFGGVFQDTRKWQSTPIWEQNHADANDDLTHSGFDRITQSQQEVIAGLIEVKGLEGNDLKEYALLASNGATNNFATLSREDAQVMIDTMAAL